MTRVALYVEGAAVARAWVESPLERLWKELSRRVCSRAQVDVIGISKSHIESLKFDPAPANPKQKLATNVIGIDQLIRDRHLTSPLENVVIAFDCRPSITAPGLVSDDRCGEIEWLLRRVIQRRVLPSPFLDAATKLQALYSAVPKRPRSSGRPPRLGFEVLFMDPCFEALFAYDKATVRTGTGHARYPKDWPKFDPKAAAPDRSFLDRATKLATADARKGIPGTYIAAKNEWGHRFVSCASDNAALFKHDIARRLGTLLV